MTQGQRHAADSQYQRSKTKDMLETSTAYVRNTGTKTCCRQAVSEKQGQNVLQTAYIREIEPKTLQTAYISETGPKTRYRQPTSVKQGQKHVADSLHQ